MFIVTYFVFQEPTRQTVNASKLQKSHSQINDNFNHFKGAAALQNSATQYNIANNGHAIVNTETTTKERERDVGGSRVTVSFYYEVLSSCFDKMLIRFRTSDAAML